MKRSFVFLCAFFIGCPATEEYHITVEESGTKVATGIIDRSLFEEDEDFRSWFEYRYNEYIVDSASLQEILSMSEGMHFVIFTGTWCGDSKREIPHLLKILDKAQIGKERIWMYGVDRSKRSADGMTEKYNILRVPTLIIFKGDDELGRIVEQPRETLEKDILRILYKQ